MREYDRRWEIPFDSDNWTDDSSLGTHRLFHVKRFELPAPGSNLKGILVTALLDPSLNREGLKIQQIGLNRVDVALRSGADRDQSSNIDYLGETDDESAAMREHKIFAHDQETYASELDRMLPVRSTRFCN